MGKADFSETVNVMALMLQRESQRREDLAQKAAKLAKERKRKQDSEERRAAGST